MLRDVNVPFLIVGGGASIVAYWVLRTSEGGTSCFDSVSTPTRRHCWTSTWCTAVSLSFAIVTPLQSGEMLKVELLKRYGIIRRFPGYGSFLVERALDMAGCYDGLGVSLITIVDILRIAPTPTRSLDALKSLVCLRRAPSRWRNSG